MRVAGVGKLWTEWTEGSSGGRRAGGCREPSTAHGICGRPGPGAAEALLGPSCFEDHSPLTSTAVTCSGSLCHRTSDACEREALVHLNGARSSVSWEVMSPFLTNHGLI